MTVQCLSRESLKKIEVNAPNVFNELKDRLKKYDDEDMRKRLSYIRNIPFLRKLSAETVRAISYEVLHDFTFEAGDCILKQGENQSRILIIKKGQVQVRISRMDPETGERQEYWMANLKEGSCINAYNCFQKDKESFFSFYILS
jgi:hypothetical protein